MVSSYTIAPKHEMLIIDMAYVNKIDISGIYALEDLIKNAIGKDIQVFVLNANTCIEETLEKVDFSKCVGINHYSKSRGSIISAIAEHYNLP